MPSVCVDASIVIKLVLDERDSAQAQELWTSWLSRSIQPVGPVFLAIEGTSAIRTRAHRKLLTLSEADKAIELLANLRLSYVWNDRLTVRAFELATQLNQPTIYDTLYLAVAEAHDCDFWTADEAFFKTTSAHLTNVHLLAHFEGFPTHADS
jgi:predicted nucleic acid-binding protein